MNLTYQNREKEKQSSWYCTPWLRYIPPDYATFVCLFIHQTLTSSMVQILYLQKVMYIVKENTPKKEWSDYMLALYAWPDMNIHFYPIPEKLLHCVTLSHTSTHKHNIGKILLIFSLLHRPKTTRRMKSWNHFLWSKCHQIKGDTVLSRPALETTLKLDWLVTILVSADFFFIEVFNYIRTSHTTVLWKPLSTQQMQSHGNQCPAAIRQLIFCRILLMCSFRDMGYVHSAASSLMLH